MSFLQHEILSVWSSPSAPNKHQENDRRVPGIEPRSSEKEPVLLTTELSLQLFEYFHMVKLKKVQTIIFLFSYDKLDILFILRFW